MFVPSPQKQAALDWVANGKGSAVVVSVAGSGKTTLLIDAIKLMLGSIVVLAYNKPIQMEVSDKLKHLPQVDVKTAHSAGFGAWRKAAPKAVLDEDKCRKIFRKMCPESSQDKYWEGCVLNMVSKAKNAAMGVVNEDDIFNEQMWLDIIDLHDIDTLSSDAKAVALAQEVLKQSVALDFVAVDFDDMIYAPLIHNANFFKYDWILVDECQDTNLSRRLMYLRMMKPDSRMLAVGDPHQAIYAFQGADADSIKRIAESVDAISLPLTVSYRCPKAVVAHAQQWVSHIQSADDAPEGVVAQMPDIKELANAVKPGDAVLCRYNAPLVEYAYKLIAAGIPAKIMGRDIGKGLQKLARKWKKVNSLDGLSAQLDKYEEAEVAKLMAKEQKNKAQSVQDRCYCLSVLIDRAHATMNEDFDDPIEFLCQMIDKIFGDSLDSKSVVFSSIHKAKGREWGNVFWLQAGANNRAKQQWQKDQEVNLLYVAATRAKEKLVLVTVPRKKKSFA